jgi:hypothetical protein
MLGDLLDSRAPSNQQPESHESWICECGNHNVSDCPCPRCKNPKPALYPGDEEIERLALAGFEAWKRVATDAPIAWRDMDEKTRRGWLDAAKAIWTVSGFERYSLKMARIRIAELEEQLRKAGR